METVLKSQWAGLPIEGLATWLNDQEGTVRKLMTQTGPEAAMGMWPLPKAMSQYEQIPLHICHVALTSSYHDPTVPGTDPSLAGVAPVTSKAREVA